MTPEQQEFLLKAAASAKQAGHVFPEMAACEAALESGFGKSGLATLDNNLFGMKQHKHPIYGTHVLPTREFLNGEWETVEASWVHYPDQASCFADRMSTLQRLASVYPHYANALDARDANTYVIQVSESWSTDPGWQCSCGAQSLTDLSGPEHLPPHVVSNVPGLGRALKVLAIYGQMVSDWDAASSSATTAT